MFTAIENALISTKIKVNAWFHRVFKEQAGGAEIIATLVIIAVVLVLALTFKDKLSELVANLWNGILGSTGKKGEQPSIPSWE